MQFMRRVIPSFSHSGAQKWLIWRGLRSYRGRTQGLRSKLPLAVVPMWRIAVRSLARKRFKPGGPKQNGERTTSAHPPFLYGCRLIFFDFHAKADAPVSERLVADVHHACGATHLLGTVAGYIRGHANGGLDGHANLQGGGGCEEETASRDVQGFGKVLGLVGGYAHRAEAQRRPMRHAR